MKRLIFAVIIVLTFASKGFAGKECEVVGFSPYENLGLEFVDNMYVQVIEKCASVTVRNTGDRARYATDYDLTATFENGDAETRHIDNESDRLRKIEPGEKYTTAKCFGRSDYNIVKMDCGF